jgi:nucleoside-diphosphate-sugar epimerase
MKYFVTGGTGFIGSRLVRQLVAEGHEVTALVRSPARAHALATLGVALHAGDITDKASLWKGMQGSDGVFHLAAWYKVGARDSSAALSANVDGTRNVLELMRDLGIRKGVYTSTLAVFSDTRGALVDETYRHAGPFLSEYDRTKWSAHYEVALPMMKEGLPLVIVQPGVNYGPGDPSPIGVMFRDYLRRKLPVVPDKVAYCWAHVDDTARGHIQAMEKGRPGESYIIAGPPHSLREVFQVAERITGVRAPRLHPGHGVMKVLAATMRLIEKVTPVPETFSSETLRVMAGVTYLGNPGKARRELGFHARPIEAGLEETLRYEMRSPEFNGDVRAR